jgi:PAS domain S-box-containing protein
MQRSGNDLERACAELAAYQSAFERHALVSLADPAGNSIRVNDLFCQISGHKRSDLVGHSHRVLQSGRHTREFWAELWRTITRGVVWRGEICNRAKSGHLFWTETTIVPLCDAEHPGAGDAGCPGLAGLRGLTSRARGRMASCLPPWPVLPVPSIPGAPHRRRLSRPLLRRRHSARPPFWPSCAGSLADA